MAEIISRKNKKLSPKVDLTPMVDLGFLLITFFIVTTSMTTKQVMPLAMPTDGKEAKISAEKTLHLILKANNEIVYYNGLDSMHTRVCSFDGTNSIRNLLLNKRQTIQQKFGNAIDLMVLIKPTSASIYKNLVDILDEIKINGINKYMILEPSKLEANF